MATDPVTGAPTFDFGVSITQIPFKKLPTPFADQTNIPEPGRTMMYPDDAPPVLANLNAHYDGSSQAQSVHTDGNHALLVSDVKGGGGGSPVAYLSKFGSGTMAGNHEQELIYFPDGISVLYGVIIGYAHPSTSPIVIERVHFKVRTASDSDSFYIANLYATYIFQASTNGGCSAMLEKAFNPPIDIHDIYGGVPCFLVAEIVTTGDVGEVAATVFYVPGS